MLRTTKCLCVLGVTTLAACGPTVPLGGNDRKLSADGGTDRTTPTGTICEFAEDNNNCWRKMVPGIDACLGQVPVGERGTFNADGTLCSYPSGRTIEFAVPMPTNTDLNGKNLDFTAIVAAQACVHYISGSTGITVTDPDGKVLHETINTASGVAVLVCPDGSQFSGTGLDVLGCIDASFGGGLPGVYFTWAPNQEEVGLTGGNEVFNCISGV
jgi:hypothetical protein